MNSSLPSAGAFEAAVAEYLSRVDEGEQPDRNDYLKRYPDCREQLAAFFDDLDFVNREVARELGYPQAASPRNGRPADRLGQAPIARLPTVAGFTVIEEIGRGSQGRVYRAVQHGTHRTVALKIIREGVLASPAERRRFQAEVSLASRLQHPHIAAVYACGEDDGRAYYAMQHVDGQSLDVYLSTRTLGIRETLDLFLQVCDAVVYAHQRGVIHRDLKPSNILVAPNGHAYIVDFGLAKSIRPEDDVESAGMTQVGEFTGTLYYASPEQVRRRPTLVDVRTDVYALGVIFYELLTDCYPYQIQDESREGLSHHILTTAPTRPSLIRRDIDDDLETIVLRALDKDIERRYPSVEALAGDLRRYIRGEAIEAKRDSHLYVLRKSLRRHRWAVAGATAVFIALLAFGATVSVLYRRAESARATIKARMDIVRDSQRYVLDKLDELSWLANRADNGAALSRQWLARGDDELMTKELAESLLLALNDLPEDAKAMGWPGGEFDCAEFAGWPSHVVAALEEVERLALAEPFPFPIHGEFDAELVADVTFDYSGHLAVAGTVLARKAFCQWAEGRHDEALRALSAASGIGVALCDARMAYHKVSGVNVRLWGYHVALQMLRDPSTDLLKRRLVEWTIQDPLLPRFRHSLIVERLKLSQVLEEATVSEPGAENGYIDINLLARAKEAITQTGMLTDENRARARQIPADEVLKLADVYFNELARWEGLSAAERAERFTTVHRELREHPAWFIVRPLLPKVEKGLAFSARSSEMRNQLLATAIAYQEYWQNGRWPETPYEIDLSDAGTATIDAESMAILRIRVENNVPILYYEPEMKTGDSGIPSRIR